MPLPSLRTLMLNGRRLTGRRVGLGIIYHRLAERSGDPRRELVPAHAVALFEAQTRYLQAHFRLVRASELPEATADRRRNGRFPAAVTFDDDLASHAALAMPVLSHLDAPATFFLCGASLDGPFRFWWERMQAAFDLGEVASAREIVARHSDEPVTGNPSATIHELAGAVERLAPEQQDHVSAELESLVGPDPPDSGMRAADVAAVSAAGFEIGFHTRRHRQLPSLSEDALTEAMRDGRDRLSTVAGQQLRMIAYPHGKGDPRVAIAAEKSGFALGFTTSWAPVTPDTSPWLMGRLQPALDSVGAFGSRVEHALFGPSRPAGTRDH